MSKGIVMDPERRSAGVVEFERKMLDRVVGQERAVGQVARMLQVVEAGMNVPGRPLASLLFLGPTGTGKTRVVEAAAEILFGDANSVIKIDCAEYQHGHEIAKLIGSPPGYLGHRETPALLSQKTIDQHQTEEHPITLVLFDEVEKASNTLWQLLLGVLDKATLTLGDNQKVDFSRTVVVLTSNLGSKEISELVSGKIGFTKPESDSESKLNQRIYRAALEAARGRFSPEFMNRIDKLVVFRSLGRDELRQIVDIELRGVQNRILESSQNRPFLLRVSTGVKDFLLEEGWDSRYGARHLKRAIERHIVYPLSSLMATGQIGSGDEVRVEASVEGRLVFRRKPAMKVVPAVRVAGATAGGSEAQGAALDRVAS